MIKHIKYSVTGAAVGVMECIILLALYSALSLSVGRAFLADSEQEISL